jgi:hypothetical protein
MGQNNGLDRQIRDLAKLGQNVLSRRRRLRGVNDDQPIVAYNHVNIGRCKTEGLIDIIRKLHDFLFEISWVSFEFGMHIRDPFDQCREEEMKRRATLNFVSTP